MTTSNPYQKPVDALGKILSAFSEVEESQRSLLLKTVTDFLQTSGVLPQVAPAASTLPQTQGGATPPATTSNVALTPKAFIEQKLPTSDQERVACLAFYLTHFREQPHFTSVDLGNLNTEAHQTKFNNIGNTVNNAANSAKYLASAGRGMKQISSLGEHLVNALPDREAVKAVLKKYRARSRRGAKKKAAKAKG